MSSLHIQNLSKAYSPESYAAKDVNIDLQSGRWLTLLGPSGCGKSTTLNCIAGLETPASGIIRLGDKTLFGPGVDLQPEDRDVGMVFQSYALWPHLTVEGNIEFPLRLRGVASKERRERVASIAALVELGDMLHRHPHELSGGQQQRVALARALVYEPQVLLLDEPLSNLDVKLRERARTWLTALQRKLKITTVYVTHDQTEALTMSHEIAVIKKGSIAQIGTPEQIYRTPADVFVADFIGAGNLINGTVSERSGDAAKIKIDDRFVSCHIGPDFSVGDDVTIAARPASLKLACGNDTAGLRVRILQETYMGLHYEYVGQLNGSEIRFGSEKRIGPVPCDANVLINVDECNVYRR